MGIAADPVLASLFVFFGTVGAAVVAAIGRQLQSEFQDWTPKAIDRLIERAVVRLPKDKQERYREEWAAHLEDTPGQVWKWRVAIGYVLAAKRMISRPDPFLVFMLRVRSIRSATGPVNATCLFLFAVATHISMNPIDQLVVHRKVIELIAQSFRNRIRK